MNHNTPNWERLFMGMSPSEKYMLRYDIEDEIKNLERSLNENYMDLMVIFEKVYKIDRYVNYYNALNKLYVDADRDGEICKAFSETSYAQLGEECKFVLGKFDAVIEFCKEYNDKKLSMSTAFQSFFKDG